MLHELTFPSYNDRDEVQAWIYVPADKPKGIVQLIHGYGEHSRRYLHLISQLVDAGYIVAADDHVGHGKTAVVNDTWGDWGDKNYTIMREDEHKLTELVKELYPDLPIFMFGHSMGSVIARDYIANYGDELAGVTICGTCGKPALPEEGIVMLTQAVEEGKGDEFDPESVNNLLGWMVARIDNPKLGNEWICHDEYVQYDHANDPFNAFTKPTNNRSLKYFMDMIQNITGEEWAEQVPTELPIYNIAGDEDPFGSYGEGVYMVSNWLADTGHNVKTHVYPGYRHEIHNYKDIQDEVGEGIISFMDEIVEE